MLNVNQVNQLFVVKHVCEENENPTNVGDIKVCTHNPQDTNPEMMYFKYMGVKGLIRTDLVPLRVVHGSHDLRVTKTLSADMDVDMNYVSVSINAGTNNENIIAGEEYVMRVNFPHLYDMGDENIYTKYASVRATSNDTASSLTFKLAKALYDNLSRKEKDSIIKITVVEDTPTGIVIDKNTTYNNALNYIGIVIEAVPQPWERGLMPQITVDMEVFPDTIVRDSEDTDEWFVSVKNGLTSALTTASYTYTPVTVHNGPKVADLEYFLMGERGDQYRMVNYPDYVKTRYMVNPNDAYDIITVHYSFIGHNEDNKRAEKDLTFVCSAGLDIDLDDYYDGAKSTKSTKALPGDSEEESEEHAIATALMDAINAVVNPEEEKDDDQDDDQGSGPKRKE